ncbi:MAG: hypothetical protein EPN26_11575 [Rhodospirillales bacterium]|nr:MAG: hypothetical protein EPN26_11575 [Rhodospirillales bacterium]
MTYIESSSALSSTGQNYSPDASAGAAILVVGASSGTGGVEVWFTTDQQQATTSNSYQIASLTGLDTGTIAVTDFQTTT